jgi:hypothetical protein
MSPFAAERKLDGRQLLSPSLLDHCITIHVADKPILPLRLFAKSRISSAVRLPVCASRILFTSSCKVGAVFAFAKNEMKTARCSQPPQLSLALHALKDAILKGATWQYEKLVILAVNAGATDEQIDLVAHEAIEALFTRAERPITPRSLTQLVGPNQFRR